MIFCTLVQNDNISRCFFLFFFFFEIFIFGAVIEGKRTKNSPKWKLKLHPSLAISQEQYSIYQQNCKNDTICRAAYLRNHISYDSIMVHLCKMMISPGVFLFLLRGVGEGDGPKWEKILSVALHVSEIMLHLIFIYGARV